MMDKFRYKLINANEDILFSNLTSSDLAIISSTKNQSQVTENKKFRIGIIKSCNGEIHAISTDPDLIRSSQKFKTISESILNTTPIIENAIYQAKEQVNNNTKRLIHNLTSLNAHSIQEIYALIPQDNINQKISTQIPNVELIVKSEPRETAITLLKIAKHNAAMKAEFSVFKNLFNDNPVLHKKNHNVHKVLMNMFYLFFPDFTDKNVDVAVSESKETAYFDYESIHVSLYHLIENATKYIKPNSVLNVDIQNINEHIYIKMKMTSLEIKEFEIESIFVEGISGELSKKLGKAGNGIGMSIAKKIILLNSGELLVRPNPATLSDIMGINYQENTFIIKLPRLMRASA